MIKIGVDTGGTFTDFVYLKDGKWNVLKVLSTPEDPSIAVLKGLEKIGGQKRDITHGTTVAKTKQKGSLQPDFQKTIFTT